MYMNVSMQEQYSIPTECTVYCIAYIIVLNIALNLLLHALTLHCVLY